MYLRSQRRHLCEISFPGRRSLFSVSVYKLSLYYMAKPSLVLLHMKGSLGACYKYFHPSELVLLQVTLHDAVKKVGSLATVTSCMDYESQPAGADTIQTVVENFYKMSLTQAK